MPETIAQFIWYIFGLLATYFLWSMKHELTGLREDAKAEREARGALELKIAAMEARCFERQRQSDKVVKELNPATAPWRHADLH